MIPGLWALQDCNSVSLPQTRLSGCPLPLPRLAARLCTQEHCRQVWTSARLAAPLHCCGLLQGVDGAGAGSLLQPAEQAVLRADGQLHGQGRQGVLCPGPVGGWPSLPPGHHSGGQCWLQLKTIWVCASCRHPQHT